jgi:hypothetical protein
MSWNACLVVHVQKGYTHKHGVKCGGGGGIHSFMARGKEKKKKKKKKKESR